MSEYSQDKNRVSNWILSTAAAAIIGLQITTITTLNRVVTENAVQKEKHQALVQRVSFIEKFFLKPKDIEIE
jgi:dipeptide/tripeptide permease